MKPKAIRWSLAALLLLTTLIALFYAVENWRGAHAWARVEAELKARGEPLTIAEFVPSPVPDEKNVRMAPLFQEVFAADDAGRSENVGEKQLPKPRIQQVKEILNVTDFQPDEFPSYSLGRAGSIRNFEKWKHFSAQKTALILEIRRTLDRPEINWNQDYGRGFSLSVPHIGPILDLANFFRLEALGHMHERDMDRALEDIRYSQRLSEIVRKDSFIIGNLVSITMDGVSAPVIWEGLHRKLWNEEQLLRLQNWIAKRPDELADYQKVMRLERAMFLQVTRDGYGKMMGMLERPAGSDWEVQMLRTCIALRPQGWTDLDRALYSRWMQRSIDLAGELQQGSTQLHEFQKLDQEILKLSGDFKQRFLTPMTFLATPSLSSIIKKTVEVENLKRQILTAIAVERFRLEKGQIPESLEMLVPTFLDSVPIDIINGQPLKYVRKGEKDYLLYSMGLNGTDDGGYTSKKKDMGDWVWPSSPGLVKVRDN